MTANGPGRKANAHPKVVLCILDGVGYRTGPGSEIGNAVINNADNVTVFATGDHDRQPCPWTGILIRQVYEIFALDSVVLNRAPQHWCASRSRSGGRAVGGFSGAYRRR